MAQKNRTYFQQKQKGVERNHQIIIKKKQRKKNEDNTKSEALQRITSILHYISWILSYSIYILIKMLLYFHTKEMTVVEKDETGMATE